MSEHTHPILPGIKPVMELLRANPDRIETIKTSRSPVNHEELYSLCAKTHIPVQNIPDRDLQKICGNHHEIAHQGIVAILKPEAALTLPDFLKQAVQAPLPLILALDQIKDPGNLGTLARTAYALGCAGLLVPKHNSASITPTVMKASSGAILSLPVCHAVNLARALDFAEEEGFTIYGAGSPTPNPVNPYGICWNLPAIIVLGSESSGLRPGVQKRCQIMIEIPFLRPFDSLNVAQAGGILMGLCAASQWRQNNLNIISA